MAFMNEKDRMKKIFNIKSEEEIQRFIQDLLSKMTLDEKIGQLYQSGHNSGAITGPEFDGNQTVGNIRKGKVGSMLGINQPILAYSLQKVAVEETRLGIPLMFCNDIIHGCVTGFPHNLALSCSFHPELIERVSRICAFESSHMGIHVTYSPMLDIVRDPRWGRVMESNGEDSYLSGKLAEAYVRGYQNQGMHKEGSIGACLKHFIGYGAAIGGREYNGVELTERNLREYYLRPFQRGLEAGCEMIMASFNTYDDVPASANSFLLNQVLREENHFKGLVVSDYTSTWEILFHKVARDERETSKKCLVAGLDHELVSTTYIDHLKDLIEKGEISEDFVDRSCLRVLRYKCLLGLFDDPYKNLYEDYQAYFLQETSKEVALEACLESLVLLENKNDLLPLRKNQKIALIGPFVKSKEIVGAWGGNIKEEECITIYDALKEEGISFDYAMGCDLQDYNKKFFDEAIEVAQKNDVILLCVGENQHMSGEGSSRTVLNLPGAQEKLLDELHKLGKKLVVLLFTGRPLILTEIRQKVDSILCCWFLATMTGTAIHEIIFGKKSPSGKLTMSFPYNEGQIPVYYNAMNTGRPFNPTNPDDRYKTRYIDCPNEALYPFGYGLSYNHYRYSDLKLDHSQIDGNVELKVSVQIENAGNYESDEIVQLYINALFFSVSRPNLELKGFKRVNFAPKEIKRVEFTLMKKDFSYFNIDMEDCTEEGLYEILIGPSSRQLLKTSIKII